MARSLHSPIDGRAPRNACSAPPNRRVSRGALAVTINRRAPRGAFTLIEILIVVVTMALLAAVAITHFNDTTTDAKKSVLTHNLHIFRSQIGLYHVSHLGQYPALRNGDLPQMTQATNAYGDTGRSSPAYPYGPYFDVTPVNPYTQSNKIVPVAQPRAKPTGVVGEPSGWQYDEVTGAIWPNHAEFYK